MLLLDEATSSLDPGNEARIQRAIDALHHRMTIVVITHRQSMIRHADAVYLMDGGRVVHSERHTSRRGDAATVMTIDE